MNAVDADDDAVDACVAVIGLAVKAGGERFELGARGETWWASVVVNGTARAVEGERSFDAACLALAPLIVDGARCEACRRLVTLDNDEGCHWRRKGPAWTPGCCSS